MPVFAFPILGPWDCKCVSLNPAFLLLFFNDCEMQTQFLVLVKQASHWQSYLSTFQKPINEMHFTLFYLPVFEICVYFILTTHIKSYFCHFHESIDTCDSYMCIVGVYGEVKTDRWGNTFPSEVEA